MRFWVRWLHFTGVARIRYDGFDAEPEAGAVYVANHPSLIDATFVLARLPHAICIVKPSLLRNPVTGPPASLAGYFSSASGIDLLRGVIQRLQEGGSLLIFPEGHRTQIGAVVNPFRHGFAMIAERARAPVQAILIRTSRELTRRGGVWWKPPQELPAYITLVLEKRWDHSPERPPAQLVAEVESYLRERLGDTPV